MMQEKTNKEILESIGRNFRQYRLMAQLTQKELSQMADVSVATIHNFESGKAYNITLNTLLTLMRHVGILDFAEALMPPQPESPYMKHKTKVRHAPRQSTENKN